MTEYYYSLDLVTEENKYKYLELYKDHYGQQVVSADEVCEQLEAAYNQDRLLYYSSAGLRDGRVIGAMGLFSEDFDDTEFQFSHLVTHTDYRFQGVAKTIIYNGVKFLIAAGAKLIKNHKRMNVIPAGYFDAMGFTMEEYPLEEYPEYKWLYTLNVTDADIVRLLRIEP